MVWFVHDFSVMSGPAGSINFIVHFVIICSNKNHFEINLIIYVFVCNDFNNTVFDKKKVNQNWNVIILKVNVINL